MNPKHAADLHWLLTSPSLLARHSLPAGVRAGDAALGEQWWQQLAVAQLPDPVVPLPFRLGRYAEQLMQAGLAALPGHRLLASQLHVRNGGVSLGEIDFLLQAPAGSALHIELAVKIYIALPLENGLCYVGPGLRDALDLKLARLFDHQLQLARTPAGRVALGTDVAVEAMAWLRGWMFYRDPAEPAWAGLAADHLRGWWRVWGEPLPQTRPDSLWRSLPKSRWLAPQPADAEATTLSDWQLGAAHHFEHDRHQHPLMVAEYAPLAEGGTELTRGVVLPPGWPDPAMLATLRARIAASR